MCLPGLSFEPTVLCVVLRRVDHGPLAVVRLDQMAPEAALRLVAYADNVTVFVSSGGEAEWVMSEAERYSEVSGSNINQEKCDSLIVSGREGETWLKF